MESQTTGEVSERPPLWRVATLVITSVVAAWGVAHLIRSSDHGIPPSPFIAAVVLSAWYAGTLTGLITTGLVLVAGLQMAHWHLDRDGWIRFFSFAAVAVLVGTLQSITTKRRVKTIQESEARLRLLLESLFTFAGIVSREGLLRDANRAALDVAGLQGADVMGKPLAETYWFSWSLAVQEQIRGGVRRAAEGTAARMLVRLRVRDGAFLTVDMNIAPILDSQRKVTALVISAVDLTPGLEASAQLAQTEKRFRATFEQAAVGLADVDFDGHFTRVNQKLCDIVGYSRDELVGKTFAELTHPDDLQEDLDAVERVKRGEILSYSLEKRYLHRAGHEVWAHLTVSLVPPSGGEPGYFISVVEDISQRRRAEEALRQQENRMRLAMEAAQMGTWEVNLDTLTVQRTGNTDQLFGLEAGAAEQLELARMFERIVEEDLESTKATVRKAVLEGGPYDVEFRVRRAEGMGGEGMGVRWLASRGEAERDETGKSVRVLGAVLDISVRKKVEEELQQAKQAAEIASLAKDQFLAVLSHELRTPLNPVLATVSYLDQHPDLPEMFRQDLELVHRNVELEARLIDDLLDLTRVSRGKMELDLTLVDATKLVDHTLEIVRTEITEKHLDVAFLRGAERAQVRGDHARLQQVFWNLLKNAIKFTPEYGRVEIKCGNDEENRWILEVQDSGVGIMPEHLGRIFDAFEQADREITRQFGGLGLGLAISKALVDLHHGKIEASSAGRNRGAIFTVRLPTLNVPASAPAPQPVRGPAAEIAGIQVLLVEDHPDTLRVMQKLLTIIGCKSYPAGTMEQARQLATEQRFDLVLSDVGLPDGNGHDLMVELRDKYGLKGIALSGFGMDADVQKSRASGFAEHLTKPIQFEQLRAAIERVAGMAVVGK